MIDVSRPTGRVPFPCRHQIADDKKPRWAGAMAVQETDLIDYAREGLAVR